MDKPVLLRVRGLTKRFGGVLAIDNVDFDVRDGEMHAVIGPNGAGKTTFISLLSGELRPDAGSIVFDGQELADRSVPDRARAGLGRSYQISQVFRDMTVMQNVLLAAQATERHSFSFLKPVATDQCLAMQAREGLEMCGLGGRANVLASALAHGEYRQLELAMTLAIRPRLLLLDEPLAGMSQAESAEMIQLLGQLKQRYSIMLIEHDMDAVFSLADRVSVLVYGRVIASGTPGQIHADDAVRTAYLGDQEEEV